MNILEKMLELDLAYLDTFTNRMNREWGYLFYNVDQPLYYDANHAHIMKVPENPDAAIKEVMAFYKEKNLNPRFYIYDFENQKRFIDAL